MAERRARRGKIVPTHAPLRTPAEWRRLIARLEVQGYWSMRDDQSAYDWHPGRGQVTPWDAIRVDTQDERL